MNEWTKTAAHIKEKHGLDLNSVELATIVNMADDERIKEYGVIFILVNALKSLSTEDLQKLGRDIASRCGADFTIK